MGCAGMTSRLLYRALSVHLVPARQQRLSMAEQFQLRLADSFMLAPSVRHLSFERADGQPLAFVPGQFLQVHFHYDDGKPTKRSYSVGTIGDGAGPVDRVEIAVSYVDGGAATQLLSGLKAGETID